MHLEPVTSSNITAIGYDADKQVLRVNFKSGGRYEYHGISPALHKSLMAAQSKGNYLHWYIRDRFTTRKLQKDEE